MGASGSLRLCQGFDTRSSGHDRAAKPSFSNRAAVLRVRWKRLPGGPFQNHVIDTVAILAQGTSRVDVDTQVPVVLLGAAMPTVMVPLRPLGNTCFPAAFPLLSRCFPVAFSLLSHCFPAALPLLSRCFFTALGSDRFRPHAQPGRPGAALSSENDPGRTRTCNPRLRRPMPYPLGHGAN